MKKSIVVLFAAVFSVCASVTSNAQSSKDASYNCGFSGMVETGVLFKDGFSGEYLSVSSGYNIFPNLFVGIGTGIKNQQLDFPGSKKSVLVPTFAQVRYRILNKEFSPFVDLKGGLVSDYSASVKQLPESQPHYGCGHFFKVGIGLEYKRYSVYFGDDWSQLQYNDSISFSGYAWTLGFAIKF